jgi:hypothetical protein
MCSALRSNYYAQDDKGVKADAQGYPKDVSQTAFQYQSKPRPITGASYFYTRACVERALLPAAFDFAVGSEPPSSSLVGAAEDSPGRKSGALEDAVDDGDASRRGRGGLACV